MSFDFESPYSPILEAKDVFCRNPTNTPYSNYLNGVFWCPDGTHLLTASADKTFRVFSLKTEDWEKASSIIDVSCMEIKEGEMIYEYVWYPYANSIDPQTFCFLSTCRGHPLHLWDAETGSVRATYRCFNAQDEIAVCTSIGFSSDGSKIYGGVKNGFFIFDIDRPGRQSKFTQTFTKTEGGLRGIVSAFAFSEIDHKIMAAGSYSGSIGIFSTETDKLLLHLLGHRGGVTKVLFTKDGNFLCSGGRMDDQLICWDIRFTSQPILNFKRDTATTHQKIYFDISPITGRHLITGGDDGKLIAFDLVDGSQIAQIPVADDTLNGVAFHPWLRWIATSTGCVGAVRRVLDKAQGVDSVDINLEDQIVKVKGTLDPKEVLEIVSKTGKKTELLS